MSGPVTPRTQPSFVALPDEVARRRLDEVLAQLSPVQRQILAAHLRHREEPNQIAARLGLSRDSARVSLSFALSQLRMALSDAPLDRARTDWLERSRTLLAPVPVRQATPTLELELSNWGLGMPAESAPGREPSDAAVAHEHLLIVERRATRGLTSAEFPADRPPATDRASPPAAAMVSAAVPLRTPARVQPESKGPVVTSGHPRRRTIGLLPRLPAALAVLVVGVAVLLGWALWGPSKRAPAAIDAGPRRVPALDAPAAPLTAPDFGLVLLRQQHEGVLEDLEFYLWLAEQETAQ